MIETKKETKEVMDIWLESVVNGHTFISEEYWKNEFNTVKKEYLPMSKTYVDEENEKIKGFISMINEEFIGALFVGVEYQNQGVGHLLLEYIKEKHPVVKLAVYCKNTAAIRFYRKNGFKIECTEMNEDTGEENYIMGYNTNQRMKKGELPC